MTSDDQVPEQDPNQQIPNESAPNEKTPKKSGVSVSKIVLLVLLLAAIAALGFDYLAKWNMDAAYNKIEKLDDDKDARDVLEGVSVENVKEALGRNSSSDNTDKIEKKDDIYIEYFDFPGVLYIHRLEVHYAKAPRKPTDTKGSGVKELRYMKKQNKRSVPRFWNE